MAVARVKGGRPRARLKKVKKKKDEEPPPPVSLKEIVLHTIFCVTFTFVMISSRDDTYSFYFGNMVRERVLNSEFHTADTEIRKTFYDCTTLADTVMYLRGPFVDAVYGEQQSYRDGRRLPEPEWGVVLEQSKLLGAVRLRQQRVVPGARCSILPVFDRWNATCYADIGRRSIDKDPFPGAVELGNGTRRVYRFDGGTGVPYNAYHRVYPSGGHTVDLPPRQLHAGAALAQLEADGFLGDATRVLFVDFTLVNANINMISVVRLVFERLESGGVFPSASVRTLRLLPYEGSGANRRLGVDGFLIAIVCYYVLQEVWEIRRYVVDDEVGLWGYFKQPWNVYDWVNIALFWGVLGMRVHVRGEMRDLADLAPFDASTHYSLQTVTDAKLIEANLMAINAILVYFKVFKYLNRVPFMNTLFATLGKASKQLFYFNIVFFIVMFASCSSFYIGFSTDVYDYRSLGASMISLIRFILGDTDIRELVYHNAYLASFLSFSFVLLVFAILVNMFLAIVNDAYSQVRKEKREYAVFVVLIEQLASNTRFVRWVAGAVRTRVRKIRAARGSEAARASLRRASDGEEEGFLERLTQKLEALAEAQTADERKTKGGGRKTSLGGGEGDRDSEEEEDPLQWSHLLHDALPSDQAVVAATTLATQQLKNTYLQLMDSQQSTLEMVERVGHAIQLQKIENGAIVDALAGKGIHFDANDSEFHRVAPGFSAPLAADGAAADGAAGGRRGAGHRSPGHHRHRHKRSGRSDEEHAEFLEALAVQGPDD